ncbi:MAG: pyridoxamine 5'-phosphate oxidase family protein [Actinobacteria bacterium]|nr:pyridoxamine 5'-phosphate oxidase family protein [Actinomycetota bacterium]
MSLGKAQEEFMRLARVARVATTRADGEPHAVPICPLLEDGKLSFATEADSVKVRNIRAVPRVAVVFDEYTEMWGALRSVLVHGRARIIERGPAFRRARKLLYEKFPQYPVEAPIEEGGSVIVEVTIDRVVSSGF